MILVRLVSLAVITVMAAVFLASPTSASDEPPDAPAPVGGLPMGTTTVEVPPPPGIPDKEVEEGVVRTVETTLEAAAGMVPTAACRWYSVSVAGLNAVRAKVWQYTQRIDWCYDGRRVYQISPQQLTVSIPTWSSALGWRFEGTKEKAQWDYFGDRWVYRSYAMGHFQYCPPRIFCFQDKFPRIWLDTYGSGRAQHYWAA
jgi:hypothetical protein